MVSRSTESRNQHRTIEIRHQNEHLNRSEDSESRNPNRLEASERRNINRPEIENQNLNHPIELQNRPNSENDRSSSNSDCSPETTLFEQIALQVHRYKSNLKYFQRLPGILNILEIVFGLLTFILILIACNNYYDPWLGVVISGFAGGKVEVFFFLTCTYGLITTTIFTVLILISNSYEKSLNTGNFSFIIYFALFAFLMFSSILLLIELSNRNSGILEFEHHFGTKVSCSILGILNSLFYLLSSSIVFKIPPTSLNKTSKHINTQAERV